MNFNVDNELDAERVIVTTEISQKIVALILQEVAVHGPDPHTSQMVASSIILAVCTLSALADPALIDFVGKAILVAKDGKFVGEIAKEVDSFLNKFQGKE